MKDKVMSNTLNGQREEAQGYTPLELNITVEGISKVHLHDDLIFLEVLKVDLSSIHCSLNPSRNTKTQLPEVPGYQDI